LLTTSGGLDTWGDITAATSSGVTPAAGANKSTMVEVRADELTEGNDYVALTLTEVADAAVDAAVVALVDQAHKGDAPPTVL